MPRFVPRVVQTLITQSPDATRVRDTLTQAIQPTLDFLNAYFVAAADGSLQILQNIAATGKAIISGSLVVQGPTTLGGLTTINGALVVNNNLSVSGTSTLTGAVALGATLTVAGVTTLNNTLNANGACNLASTLNVTGQAMFAAMLTIQADVNCTGTITANSLVSRQGIEKPIDCGVYWNSAGAAATAYQTYFNVMNQNTAVTATAQGVTPFLFRADRPGSIVGYSLIAAGSATGAHTVYYLKNGQTFGTINAGTGTGNTALGGTHVKGVYSFVAGDVLQTRIACAAAGNLQYSLQILVETTS